MMIGNGQKISPTKINLTMVESMLRYSPNPAQTPLITLSLLLFNFFIIILMWSEVGGVDLRASFRSPLQMVTPT
jgi:hypothetical protein